MIKANNLGPNELLMLRSPPLLFSVAQSAERNVAEKDRDKGCRNLPPPWPAHSSLRKSLNPTGRICRAVGGREREGRQVLRESEEGGKYS